MKRNYKDITLWKNVEQEQWNNWEWQVANRITTLEKLEQVITLTEEEKEGVAVALKKFKMAITPYYAMMIHQTDPNCPVRKQAVPSILETKVSKYENTDPLHENEDSPLPGLTHRYPDRVLLLCTAGIVQEEDLQDIKKVLYLSMAF